MPQQSAAPSSVCRWQKVDTKVLTDKDRTEKLAQDVLEVNEVKFYDDDTYEKSYQQVISNYFMITTVVKKVDYLKL